MGAVLCACTHTSRGAVVWHLYHIFVQWPLPLTYISFDFWLIKICWYMCKWCALGAREEKCGCCIKHYTLLFHTSLTYSTDLIVLIGASEQSVCLVVSVNCESWISWQQKISNSAMTIIFGERQFWLWIWLFWISK